LKAEKPLPVSTLKALDKVYSLDASTNGEIRLRWYGLALPAGTQYAESAAGKYSLRGECGRKLMDVSQPGSSIKVE
jgi:hypothetical protein